MNTKIVCALAMGAIIAPAFLPAVFSGQLIVAGFWFVVWLIGSDLASS